MTALSNVTPCEVTSHRNKEKKLTALNYHLDEYTESESTTNNNNTLKAASTG